MTFWALIIEKHCLDIFIFPFLQLFSSTITAAGESNKEIVFLLYYAISLVYWQQDCCCTHWLRLNLLKILFFAVPKQHLGISSSFVHGGLDFPQCFLSLVFSLWVLPLMSVVIHIINFDMSVKMIGSNF